MNISEADVAETAGEYVRKQSAAMAERYDGDCTVHARRIAELLLAEDRAPWIGRIRDIEMRGEAVFHFPLIPKRYLGRGSLAWTTHFVACAGGEAYDPLAGEPVGLDAYTLAVFGKALPVETHLDPEQTRRLLTMVTGVQLYSDRDVER